MQSNTETQGDLVQELRGDAKSIAGTAKERIHGEVDARKGDAATQVKSLSSALDSAAGQLGDDSPQWLRSAFQQGAQTLQRFAESVEQKDSKQLSRDVQQLARENPGTFLTGCALAGFAAARIFKAGGQSASTGQGSSSFGGYGGGNSETYDPYASSTTGSSTPATAYSSGSAGYTATSTTGGMS